MKPNPNKKALQSKKFVAFLLSQLLFAVILIIIFCSAEINIFVGGLIWIMGLNMGGLGIGYVLGVAAMEKHLGKVVQLVSTIKPKDSTE